MTRQLTLREWGSPREIELIEDEYGLLSALTDKLTIQRVPGTPGTYSIASSSSHVGVITSGDLVIHILPKVGVPRLMFLISYAIDPKRWSNLVAPVDADTGLVEAVVLSYLAHIRRALSLGLLQGYRVDEDALATVRGRILFEQQLRRRYGLVPPVDVRFDEFTEDIEENRLLRAGIAALRRLPLRSQAARLGLQRAEQAFQNITPVEYDRRRVPRIVYTRLNARYEHALELARLILTGSSLELRHGAATGTSFLIDMNVVFEEFVRSALREALGLSVLAFPAAAAGRKLWLDDERRIRLEPDLSWWDGPSCIFVGDAKYKRTQGSAAQNPDAYQLLAYLIATGLRRGTLVYAKGEAEPMLHHVVAASRVLRVTALDLDTDPRAILDQIGAAAGVIRADVASSAIRQQASCSSTPSTLGAT